MPASQMQRSFSVPELDHSIQSLLNKKEYNQAAKKLFEAYQLCKQQEDEGLASILHTAYQICLTCYQQQQNVNMYHEVYENAITQEEDFRKQLDSLLEVCLGGKTAVLPTTQTHPTSPTSLWQRVRNRLKGLGGNSEEEKRPFTPEPKPHPPSEKVPINDPPPSTSNSSNSSNSGITFLPDASHSTLAVYSLGQFRVYQNDKLITDWNGLKGQFVFKYLLTLEGKPAAKDILMDLLWPDSDSESARRNLHQAIYSLRQTLKGTDDSHKPIIYEKECYFLNPKLSLWLDFVEFQKFANLGHKFWREGQTKKAIESFGVADALYEGEFFADTLYTEWINVRRQQLKQLYLETADILSKHYCQIQEYSSAITHCRKMLVQDNCFETAHYRLMQCHIAQNQRHLAVRQYHTCKQLLAQELEILPSIETNTLYEQITTQH
ncbi:MAG: hypothetical protein DWQ04_16335 [Chloroflexi bacterium]|nr:MAG: hypothetical protein DWQ04_16335 [Chloroflexota bacterium]